MKSKPRWFFCKGNKPFIKPILSYRFTLNTRSKTSLPHGYLAAKSHFDHMAEQKKNKAGRSEGDRFLPDLLFGGELHRRDSLGPSGIRVSSPIFSEKEANKKWGLVGRVTKKKSALAGLVFQ